ncbi:MAG: hypothetical protein H6625_02870 [Bdellovibrionaceae bacterium]|nr:hypothetical protein [Pseudobdellovibrionaceae bacterium]
MQFNVQQQSAFMGTLKLKKTVSNVVRYMLLFVLLPSLNSFGQENQTKNQRAISLEWEAVEEAVGYHVEVVPIKKDGSEGNAISRKTKKSQWEAAIPFGNYKMRIRSYDSRRVPGEWSEPIDFIVRPKAVKLIEPEDSKILEVADSNELEILFKWTQSDGISVYKLKIESDDGIIKFEENINGLQAKIRLLPGKTYNWKVTPLFENQMLGDEVDKPYTLKIDVKVKELVKKIEEEKEAIDKNKKIEDTKKEPEYKSNYYYVASYLITQMNYKGVDKTNGIANQVDVMGGTGRIGVGHIKPENRFGVFGIMDMSGFNIGSDNFTFASAEIHGVYLKKNLNSELKISAGLYTKEIISVQGTLNSGYSGVGKVKNLGPHVGFEYIQSFNQKLGWQVNGRFYSAMFGEGPNGESLKNEISYEFGLLGSYQLTNNFKGFAGFKYRLDRSSYSAISSIQDSNSLARPGDINYVEITGGYLNFILEYRY